MSGERAGTAALAAYGSVAAPLAILIVPLYTYLPTFYATELHLGLAAVGAIFFASRIWDGLLDPLVGAWSDRTTLRWGRRKSWVVLTALPLMALGWMICVPPPGARYGYLAAVLFAFYGAWTCTQIPHLAWGSELAKGYVERSRVVAFRETFFMLGILSAVALPVVLLGTGRIELWSLMRLFAVMTVILVPLTASAAACLTPDPPHAVATQAPFWRDAWDVLLGSPAFTRLVSAYFLMQVGLSIFDAVALFLVSQAVGLGRLFLVLAGVQFVSTLIVLPAMSRIGNRVDKHHLLCVFLVGFPLGVGVLAMTPSGQAALAFTAYAIIGISVAPYRVMPTSMAADCSDFDLQRTGRDRTGTHMAILTLFYKLALAVGVGIAFPVLQVIGFEAAAQNSPSTLARLRLFAVALPVLTMLPALWLLLKYPLTRAVMTASRRGWLTPTDGRNPASTHGSTALHRSQSQRRRFQ